MNNLTKSMAIAAIVLSAFACQKEKLNESSELSSNQNTIELDSRYPGISIHNDILQFESVKYYESIVDNENGSSADADALTSYLRTTTFQSFFALNPESEEIDDDFVSTIVNKDRVVIIGTWMLLIDKPNDLVFAINKNEKNAYGTLISRNERAVQIFSTDDDVLDLLENPELSNERACNESSASSNNVPHSWDTYCTNYKFRLKAAYYSLGIYKKLRLEFWHKQISGNSNNTLFSLGYRYKWKKKCKNEDADVTKPMTLWDFQGDHMELKFYTGSKALSKYYIGGQWSGGATVAFQNKCTNATYYQTLVNSLSHGY